ncbi:MAG TPA: ADOP family duplicated permease [Terracidiphilus sp.]|jgi:predicted permease|nr:ADOP family duplicated permease [Terracidiphilus sp.]
MAALFRQSQVRADLDEELLFHISLRADDLERSGLPRAEAERRARIEFGARERYKEESREALGGHFMQTLLQDVRLALRVLRKSRGFAFAAIVTLALAIGANAVVFGVMDALLLHTIDVPDAKNLYGTEYGADPSFQSYPSYVDLRDRNQSFQDLAAFNMNLGLVLDSGHDPKSANAFATTGNYFTVLDLQPYLGRFYTAADEHGPGSAPFMILTYAYWHARFQDDRSIIGRVVSVNKHPFTVLGVAPPGFGGTLMFVSPDFFIPIVEQETLGGNSLTDRANVAALFETFGHLKPGVSPQQAEADVNRVATELAKAYPKEFEDKHVVIGRTGLTSFRGPVDGFVAALTALAALILLAACANLGGLFAAHASDRAKEVALRLALGSTRRRILRQLMTEALLLALGGGALGVLVGMPLLHRLSTWRPFAGTPLHIPVTMDARIYAVALLLALISGFLFGIVPVRLVMRAHPYEVIKAGSTSVAGRKITVRDFLLVVQIAICALLVTSSLVAVRGLVRSVNASYGFQPRNTLLAGVNLASAGYSGKQIPQFDRRVIDAMKEIPGVEAVGLVNNYPPLVYTAAFRENVFTEQTRDLSTSNAALQPFRFDVSPEYLKAAGTALLAGRDLAWTDDKVAPIPALANRLFVLRMFGSTSGALGKRFRTSDGKLAQVVGIVEDGKYQALTEDQAPAILLPSMPNPDPQCYLIVRSKRDPEQLQKLMRAKLRELDAGLSVDIQSWNQLLDVVHFPAKVATMALGVLGAMGAILSITGIFGMAAYSVSRRLKEFGIRVALGARRTAVLESALGRAVRLLAIGSALGLVLGLLATRVLASIVYQATPRDPIVLTGVVIAMSLLGLLATWIPAQRALRVDPMILLREE